MVSDTIIRPDMTPDEYCQQKAAQSGSSFYYSFLFLPPERRRAITALYAFCREVDDVADDVLDVTVARTKLAWWRTEIANLFDGHPVHPVTKALQPFVAPYGIDAARLNEIVDGMEMDLVYHRYPDFESLRLYCHRVAGVVGELSASIFGYRSGMSSGERESRPKRGDAAERRDQLDDRKPALRPALRHPRHGFATIQEKAS